MGFALTLFIRTKQHYCSVLDKPFDSISHAVMQLKQSLLAAGIPAHSLVRASTCLALCVLVSGCSLTPIARHAVTFSKATNTVIDNSEDAYRAAIKLRHDEQVAAAVYAYDTDPHWSPYKNMAPLLTPDQLQARIQVLDGFKAYAATLVELTGNKHSKDLSTAAAGVGSSLQALSKTASTSLANAIPNMPVMDDTTANGISTAVFALGEYLIHRKVEKALPKVTADMNPNVQALCNLLERDIDILRRQADVDYQNLIENQDAFIRHASPPLSQTQHRDEVGKLLDMAAQQKANDELLAELKTAIHKLAGTHEALKNAAQNPDAESLRQKIADLEAAGETLGGFYKSVSKN
jgi:hypothetical protein